MQFKKANTKAQSIPSKGSWLVDPKSVDKHDQLIRPSLSRPKKPFNGQFKTKAYLLELPVEIRLQIFDYVWEGAFVAVKQLSFMTRHPDTMSVETRCYSGIDFDSYFTLTGRRMGAVRSYSTALRDKKLDFKWNHGHEWDSDRLKNTGLLRTCRLISWEFSQRIYSTSIFAFNSAKTVNIFLDKGRRSSNENKRRGFIQSVPSFSDNKQFIKHLCLEIVPYNEPGLMADRIFMFSYYEGWKKVCKRMASELNLDDVTIYIRVPESRPYRLVLNDIWFAPLLELSNAKIKTAAIKLTASIDFNMSPRVLAAFAEVLRRKVLGFDDRSALEAITYGKKKYPIAQGRQSLQNQWNSLLSWNGLVDDEAETARKAQDALILASAAAPVPKPTAVHLARSPPAFQVSTQARNGLPKRSNANKRRNNYKERKLGDGQKPVTEMSV